ncbi:6632_t:CDS:1 [Entrophospora sp. SA101]|nr:6632_t:CDS:1 [Entrophospora sp. SA101]CAJ0825146.1 13414_t:CDS:1 [Entrophospora sp. SA101]CAJ0907035.1 8571_t:CDS:1 [Entrophospora sp. SA101]
MLAAREKNQSKANRNHKNQNSIMTLQLNNKPTRICKRNASKFYTKEALLRQYWNNIHKGVKAKGKEENKNAEEKEKKKPIEKSQTKLTISSQSQPQSLSTNCLTT